MVARRYHTNIAQNPVNTQRKAAGRWSERLKIVASEQWAYALNCLLRVSTASVALPRNAAICKWLLKVRMVSWLMTSLCCSCIVMAKALSMSLITF